MIALGPSWATGERAGELTLTATEGVDAVGVYVGRYLPQLVVAALAPVGVLAWVGTTDWISLLILVGLLAVVPPSMVVFGRRATEEAASRQWRGLSSLSAHLLELIQGLPTLRAFGHVDYGRREVAEATEGLRRATLRTLRVAFLSSFPSSCWPASAPDLVAMVLGLRLLDGHASLSVALAVLLSLPEVFLPLRRASAEFHASAEGASSAERIATVLGRPLPVDPDTPGSPSPIRSASRSPWSRCRWSSPTGPPRLWPPSPCGSVPAGGWRSSAPRDPGSRPRSMRLPAWCRSPRDGSCSARSTSAPSIPRSGAGTSPGCLSARTCLPGPFATTCGWVAQRPPSRRSPPPPRRPAWTGCWPASPAGSRLSSARVAPR